MLKTLLSLIGIGCMLVTLTGCVQSQQATSTAQPPSVPQLLRVFAASSLTEVCDELAPAFEAAHPGTKIQATYAGTQELRVQLEQGAQCDVFISASKQDMEALTKQQLVTHPQILATNKLCVIVWPGSKVKTLQDLVAPQTKIVIAVPSSPIGRYTRQAFEKIGESSEFGAEYLRTLHQRVVSEETNVKLVLTKVELGEADAGFAYTSDVIGHKVIALELPASVQVQATYLLGLGLAGKDSLLAEDYLRYLLSNDGAAVFKKHGFGPPPTPKKPVHP